jgi:flagellar basal-body rod protein FlgB
MRVVGNHLFDKTDAVLEHSLNQRLAKHSVILSNVVNSNTPGFRALGYDFESQLQSAVGNGDSSTLRVSQAGHFKHPGLTQNGDLKPDLFVKPTESIGSDGNTVDVDQEMSDMAANQVLYRATVEILNRKLGLMRYGISGGR